MKYDKLEKNYYNNYDGNDGTKLEDILGNNEIILWRGKPKKSAFIWGKCFVMAPFALLWLGFDSIAIAAMFNSPVPTEMIWFFILFFAFHLLPVWMWLGSILSAKKKYENAEYAVTNYRLIIKGGFIGVDYKSISYKDISNVNLKVGLIDKILGVGDIYISTTTIRDANSNRIAGNAFLDVEDPYKVYSMIQKTIVDIQTDIQYPNALRPDNNPGYNTKYDNSDYNK